MSDSARPLSTFRRYPEPTLRPLLYESTSFSSIYLSHRHDSQTTSLDIMMPFSLFLPASFLPCIYMYNRMNLFDNTKSQIGTHARTHTRPFTYLPSHNHTLSTSLSGYERHFFIHDYTAYIQAHPRPDALFSLCLVNAAIDLLHFHVPRRGRHETRTSISRRGKFSRPGKGLMYIYYYGLLSFLDG